MLCELCINAAPAGTVRVLKLYSGEQLPAYAAGARLGDVHAAAHERAPVSLDHER